MATAKKLPSGSWRVYVFSHYEIRDGKKKRIYKSFTSDDKTMRGKREAEQKAAEWALKRDTRIEDVSLYDAAERYVAAKEGVLSPSTVRAYKSIMENHLGKIGVISLQDLDDRTVQMWISSLDLKPKTVHNVALFVNAVYKYYTNSSLSVRLPKKDKPDLHTPTDEEIRALLDHVKGTRLEIAIMLAAFCSLRRGEICALERSDFHDGMVFVTKAMVHTPEGTWEVRRPKTTESIRSVPVPDVLMEKLPDEDGQIMGCCPDALSNRFNRAVKFTHLENHIRFHDLRHYYASMAHYLGVPDAFIMASGGWATDNVMKRVYREAMADKRIEENKKITDHASNLVK